MSSPHDRCEDSNEVPEEDSDTCAAPCYPIKFKRPRKLTAKNDISGSKYGGQPNWLTAPQWPVSKVSGNPMIFVLQIELPEGFRVGGHSMAYLFVEDCIDGPPCDAEEGMNAIILQGGRTFQPHVATSSNATGPTLQQGEDVGASIPFRDPESPEVVGSILIATALKSDLFAESSFLGGAPHWLQWEETPSGGPWLFLAQIYNEHIPCWVPFDAFGYLFVAEDGGSARVLFQFT